MICTMINYRTYSDLARDVRRAAAALPRDLALIVGVPRSGMIPAYMLSAFLHVPVCTLPEYLHGIAPSSGSRPVRLASNGGQRVLIVDDSVQTGASMQRTRRDLILCKRSDDFVFFAVYATMESKDMVDIHSSIVEQPRLFQWNYSNHAILSLSCVDMDGVLCLDPTDEQNDDGDLYREFLMGAKPLYVPMHTVFAIVTSRLEKYRNETETWLRENNVRYERLCMLDLPSKAERQKMNAHAKFKSKVYSGLGEAILFIESDREQALEIARETKKQVICIATDEMFSADPIDDGDDVVLKRLLEQAVKKEIDEREGEAAALEEKYLQKQRELEMLKESRVWRVRNAIAPFVGKERI
jgi:uncharacterized HAD superfamily protein/hypoxanthine phosphoribosyltransferase